MTDVSGVIVVDKPEGWTSNDVVQKVKRGLNARKAGHLGTLDPAATGVLPLVINGATKFACRMTGRAKEYLAVMKLGVETDTWDREGRVTASADVNGITGQAAEAALKTFVGKIAQVPPMYSAIKVNGRPLYKLARQGVVIEREPRHVEIYGITIKSFDLPYVEFMVSCSGGTYVRSLCYEAGRKLGCGAHLSGLRRTLSSGFSIDEAISPESPAGALFGAIIPLPLALSRFPARQDAV